MKYKAKFTGYTSNGVIPTVKEGQLFETQVNPELKGLIVFIPFTDERFFELVETRKFQVEVSEENMNEFSYRLGIRGYHSEEGNDPRWTVTEITENKYLEALKANREVSEEVIQVMSENDYAERVFKVFESFHKDHTEKLPIIKEMKYWLVAHLPDISGLKEAKNICDSWWNFV